jgi:hypothetical protein
MNRRWIAVGLIVFACIIGVGQLAGVWTPLRDLVTAGGQSKAERAAQLKAELTSRADTWYRALEHELNEPSPEIPTRSLAVHVLKRPPGADTPIYGAYPELSGVPFERLFNELGDLSTTRRSWVPIRDMMENQNQPERMDAQQLLAYAGKIRAAIATYRID